MNMNAHMQYKMSQSDWLRIGEEAGWLRTDGEQVVLAKQGKSNVAGAVFRVMRTPEMAKKIIELSKLWKSNSSEFSNKFQDLEQQIVVDYHNFLDTGASDYLFVDRIKLRRIIEKIIYKMLEVGDLGVREAGEEDGGLKEALRQALIISDQPDRLQRERAQT